MLVIVLEYIVTIKLIIVIEHIVTNTVIVEEHTGIVANIVMMVEHM